MRELFGRWAAWGVVIAIFFGTAERLARADEQRDTFLASVRAQIKVSPLDRQHGRVQRLSLNDCIRLTLQNNQQILAEDYGIGAAKAQADEAHLRWWPVFDYEYRMAPVPQNVGSATESLLKADVSWFNATKVGVALPITGFGKIGIAQRLAGQGVVAARVQKLKESATAVARVQQIYYGLQLGEDLSNLMIEAIEKISDKVEGDTEPDFSAEDHAVAPPDAPAAAAPSAASEGTSDDDLAALDRKLSPIDKLRLRTLRSELEKKLAEARMKQELGLAALRTNLGLPSGAAIGIAHRALETVPMKLFSLDSYINRALSQRPDANLVEVGVEAKRLEYELERKKMLPDVGLGAFFEIGRTVGAIRGLTATDDFTNPFNYSRGGVGLQLKGRWDPHGGAARILKKQNEFFKVSLQRDMAKAGIALEVEQAYLDAKNAMAQVTRAKESESVARRLLFLTKSNMDIGVGENRDFTDALQLTLITRGQYFESVYEWDSAVAKLAEKTGVVPDAVQ